jgi:hypothetical protein
LCNFFRTKDSSAREISTLRQREIELESDLKALQASMIETEESLLATKQNKDREMARIIESHRQDMEQLKIAHENELQNLSRALGEQSTLEFEKRKQDTDIRILHLDTRVSEMTEERAQFIRQIEVYKDEARKLRYELSKKEMQNSRLSEVFIARSNERRFSELPRLSSDFEIVRNSNKFVRVAIK